MTSDQVGDAQGVIVLSPQVNRDSLVNCEELLAVGRFGVGYDSVDVNACTQSDVVVFITPGAVDRSVAEATIGWMLALTHQVRRKKTGSFAPGSGMIVLAIWAGNFAIGRWE